MKRAPWFSRLLLLLSAGLYAGLLYGTARTDHLGLMLLFGSLFLGQWLVIRRGALGVREMQAWALGLRLLAFFAFPALSDDFYRFFWDGLLLRQGLNPLAATPEALLAAEAVGPAQGFTAALFAALNSPGYFTVYPPVLQFIFWLGASLSPHSIYGAMLAMKVPVLLAEAGSIWLLPKLLKRLGRAPETAAWYLLHPLVIVELCGNLHFEALMIFGLLAAGYACLRGRPSRMLPGLVLAIGSKLLPVILLPFLLRRVGWGRGLLIGGLSTLGAGLLFVPLLDGGGLAWPQGIDRGAWWLPLAHLTESVRLYYQTFEFNGGLYQLIRWAGFEIRGYNIIRMAGPWLAAAKVAGIALILLLERRPRPENLFRVWLWAFILYFALASIVHPWYLTTLVALATLTRYRFAMLWAALSVLSYLAYQVDGSVVEASWWLGVEYGLVGTGLVTEWLRKKEAKAPSQNASASGMK
jgi:alpha-1,6-mannosyltransferase